MTGWTGAWRDAALPRLLWCVKRRLRPRAGPSICAARSSSIHQTCTPSRCEEGVLRGWTCSSPPPRWPAHCAWHFLHTCIRACTQALRTTDANLSVILESADGVPREYDTLDEFWSAAVPITFPAELLQRVRAWALQMLMRDGLRWLVLQLKSTLLARCGCWLLSVPRGLHNLRNLRLTCGLLLLARGAGSTPSHRQVMCRPQRPRGVPHAAQGRPRLRHLPLRPPLRRPRPSRRSCHRPRRPPPRRPRMRQQLPWRGPPSRLRRSPPRRSHLPRRAPSRRSRRPWRALLRRSRRPWRAPLCRSHRPRRGLLRSSSRPRRGLPRPRQSPGPPWIRPLRPCGQRARRTALTARLRTNSWSTQPASSSGSPTAGGAAETRRKSCAVSSRHMTCAMTTWRSA